MTDGGMMRGMGPVGLLVLVASIFGIAALAKYSQPSVKVAAQVSLI